MSKLFKLTLRAVLAGILVACAPAAPATQEPQPEATEAAPEEPEAAPEATEAATEAPTEAPTEAVSAEPVTFVFGAQGDAVKLDSAVVTDGESFRIIEQGCEGLVEFEGGTNNPVPALAESWEASDDLLTWTFHLRQGVTFHDGTPFNADAVVFNFDRWRDTSNPYHFADQVFEYYEAMWGGFDDASLITNVEATDDYTVVFTLSDVTTVEANMAMGMFSIHSPQAIEDYGEDYGTPDVGYVCTGPYEFIEWVPGDHITMERYPDYWGDVTGNVERIIVRPIVDPAARFAALQAGEIDGYFGATPEDVEAAEGNADLQVLRRPPLVNGYLAFNYRVVELQDVRVRQAIGMAINRQAIVDAFFGGAGQVANQWLPPGTLGYDPDALPGYQYDPDGARALLAEAGYADGLTEVNVLGGDDSGNITDEVIETGTLKLYVMPVTRPYMPDSEGIAQAVAADLAAVGIQTELVSLGDWGVYLDGRANGELTGLYFLGWTGDNGDSDNFIGYFFANVAEPLPREGYYQNAEVADLLNQARSSTDPDERASLYTQAEQMLYDNAARIWLAYNQPALLLQSYVSGYQPSPTGTEYFKSVEVNK